MQTQIQLKHPVLYVALYKPPDPESQKPDYGWSILIGQAHERYAPAGDYESEGIRCRVEAMTAAASPVDGLRWKYRQDIVPLRGEDDVLVRLMLAEVVNLDALLGILRDNFALSQTTPSSTSYRWVKQKLKEVSEKPDCLGRWSEEGWERVGEVGRVGARELWKRRGDAVRPKGLEVYTVNLFKWIKPAGDEYELDIRVSEEFGGQGKVAKFFQVATGTLSRAAQEMRLLAPENRKAGKGREGQGTGVQDKGRGGIVLRPPPGCFGTVWRKSKDAEALKDDGEGEEEEEDGEREERQGQASTTLKRARAATKHLFEEASRPQSVSKGKQATRNWSEETLKPHSDSKGSGGWIPQRGGLPRFEKKYGQ
ncbi:MAG: hypothetical protein ALECFALPRED_008772 [Alectoria fallacina]|uniref:Uncharacterized protein n=1 Tax=Alectoria fallacina TaxID=1903189 RepID=A0A8H3PG74_9LECA|nr:MAG: hypothetical protein ALECFALPRED_008772 [Alectoria fallacina]